MKASFVMKPSAVAGILGLGLSLGLFHHTARADWPNPTNITKFVQLPDLSLTGLDVLATAPKVLADDFIDPFTGPIIGIHIWGSWNLDQVGLITNFVLSFHSDLPAGSFGTNYSRPGPLLWEYQTGMDYSSNLWAVANEGFYDPNIDAIIGVDSQVYQYNFRVPEFLAFTQQANTIYWLNVQAQVVGSGAQFGWKTSTNGIMDDAVFDDTLDDPHFWRDMRYPAGHPLQGQSINLAFALETIPEPGAASLLAVGGLTLGAWCLRRKKRR